MGSLGAPLRNFNGGILGGSTAKRTPTLEKKNENYNVGQKLSICSPMTAMGKKSEYQS